MCGAVVLRFLEELRVDNFSNLNDMSERFDGKVGLVDTSSDDYEFAESELSFTERDGIKINIG